MRGSASSSHLAADVEPSRWGLIKGAKSLNPKREMMSGVLKHLRECTRAKFQDKGSCAFKKGEEIDICITGGGLRGYYVTGAWAVLEELREIQELRIKRYSGASAGAWCAVFMCCGLHILDWVETYYETRFSSEQDLGLLDAYDHFLDRMMLKALPEDASVGGTT